MRGLLSFVDVCQQRQYEHTGRKQTYYTNFFVESPRGYL